MPTLLRRRRKLICFYCQGTSDKRQDGSVRQWKCAGCGADNFLDEHGELTDPPTSTVGSGNVQYARPMGRVPGTTAVGARSSNAPFCATCSNNQNIVVKTLASYLPEPTHPDFAKYEELYPAFRSQLEERYPQVCVDCEPRVRERIRHAGYVAKTDHLRRMIERSRGGAGNASLQRRWWQCGWQGWAVLLGGLGWWSSLLGQASWHLLRTVDRRTPDEARDGIMAACVSPALQGRFVRRPCLAATDSLLPAIVVLGLASMWWHNQMARKVREPGLRLTGLADYYKIQVLLMLCRMLVSWCWGGEARWEGRPAYEQAPHVMMLASLTMCTVVSLRAVKIDRRPRFSFPDTTAPLVAGPSAKPRAAELQSKLLIGPLAAVAPHQHDPLSGRQVPFIHVIPPSQASSYAAPSEPTDARPVTPVTPDPDAMEWTPTIPPATAPLNPFQPHRHAAVAPAFLPPPTTTLFQHRLPPAPKAPAAKLRTAHHHTPRQTRSGGHDEDDDASSPLARWFPFQSSSARKTQHTDGENEAMSSIATAVLAPPRFFPPSADYSSSLRSNGGEPDPVAGLESHFDLGLSMRDDPILPAEPHHMDQGSDKAGDKTPAWAGMIRIGKKWVGGMFSPAEAATTPTMTPALPPTKTTTTTTTEAMTPEIKSACPPVPISSSATGTGTRPSIYAPPPPPPPPPPSSASYASEYTSGYGSRYGYSPSTSSFSSSYSSSPSAFSRSENGRAALQMPPPTAVPVRRPDRLRVRGGGGGGGGGRAGFGAAAAAAAASPSVSMSMSTYSS
ncbi:MAG: hypothetical protein M1826_003011 [Phylliscum demangeonii]|nr:MAG: hypothetical protein M1826_003011 [Phylliscum demangeonii]